MSDEPTERDFMSLTEAELFALTLRNESVRRVDDLYVHNAIIRNQMRTMADTIERWERGDFRPDTTEHEPRWRGTGYGGGRMVCRCGDDCEDGYNAHAAALRDTP